MPPEHERLRNISIALAARCSPLSERCDYLELVRERGTPSAALDLPEEDRRCRKLRAALASGQAERKGRRCLAEIEQDPTVQLLLFGDRDYPERLAAITDAPPVLFVRGTVSSMHNAARYLAVVGSRRADEPGCAIAEELSCAVVARGGCIVSGLALGIDSAAHYGALRSRAFDFVAPTVAVLGSGLGTIYPGRNRELADQIIAAGGALVSQFDYGAQPLPTNFLDRNRVIAGLSQAVLVIEAPLRSGALSTAHHALEQGRDLLVVPGDIRDRRYEGSNQLLRKGAGVITGVGDLVSELFGEEERGGGGNRDEKPRCDELPIMGQDPTTGRTFESVGSAGALRSELRRRILTLLRGHRTLARDRLTAELRTDNGAAEFLSILLLELELEGLVTQLPGNQFALRAR